MRPTWAMAATDGPQPAGFWRRYAAWSLDAAAVGVPTLLLSAHTWSARAEDLRSTVVSMLNLVAQRLTDALMQGGDPVRLAHELAGDASLQSAMAATLAQIRALLFMPVLWFVVLAAIYWIGFEASRWQATPGKRALRMRTTDLTGARPGRMRATLRHAAGALSWLTLNLGHALAAWTPQKRALHDYLAGTRVIVDEGADTALPAWARCWLWLQAVVALLSSAWLYLYLLGALQSAVGSAPYY